jgi:acetyl esterase/lipase
MIYEVINLDIDGYNLETSAQLYCYRLDNTMQSDVNKKRPAIIICPGGGYVHTSDREAEPIAMRYLAAGYHAFVLRYHVAPVRFPVALLELASVIKLIRENAKAWKVDETKVILNGFSAGGHLAGSLCNFWASDWLAKKIDTTKEMIQPNGGILAYPVITSGEFAHRGSFDNLLGEQQELLGFVSLEHQVNESTPPMFLWHTYTDTSVPVENSLLLIEALRKHKISTEFHMYPFGGHGLALANQETVMSDGCGIQEECQGWIDMAIRWILNLGGTSC